MEAYDALLTEMQKMATDAYQVDRGPDDKLWRQDYVFPVDEVHDKLQQPLVGVLIEVRDRLTELSLNELRIPRATAADHLRALTFSVAANDVDMYIQGMFSLEPVETRVPEEMSLEETTQAITDALAASPVVPHFMFDASTGSTVGIYGKSQLPVTEGITKSGHTRWVVSAERRERASRRVTFGEDIRTRRKALGHSVKHLSGWIEIHPDTLRALEAGMEENVGGTLLRQGHWLVQRLAEYLNTTVEEIYPWDDDKEKDNAW